jgi:hypothetical protein
MNIEILEIARIELEDAEFYYEWPRNFGLSPNNAYKI